MTLKQIMHASASWQETAARKRQQDLAKIPTPWRLSPDVIEQAKQRRSIADDFVDGLLDSDTRRITNLDVPALMELTGNGSLSAVCLTTAFCKRAAYGHQLNHNLLEIGFDQATARAESLDAHWQAHRKPIGPLHGLPITMKDQFHINGMDTTMAYVGWISPLKRQPQSQIVQELESLGAIVIAKSTLTQALGAPETNNNILGYHFNPRNQQLSSGGSSGGEGAIQALRGSAIGIGSDNGGSVSIPAAFNGVYSIKPSPGRLSFLNVANPSPGQNNIPTVPGVLGSSVASLKYFLKSLASSQPWLHDPDVVPFPWKDDIQHNMPLSFGLMKFDGAVMPHPPITRGLGMVADALRAAGHELIEWHPPAHSRASAIQAALVNANGGYEIFENLALSREPLVPELEEDYPDGKPNPPFSSIRVEKEAQRLHKYKLEYHHYWMSTANKTRTGRPVDAIILPVWGSAAIIPGKPSYGDYIGVSNVVNHTTMVIPITRADMHLDKFDENYSPINDEDRDNWKSYDPQVYHGTPVGIQIECRRFEEEKLLDIGQIVVDALSDWKSQSK
ncbi:hypothetical protein CEP52_011517 [Fusarium oligoseptatum]|uniref:Amidase domain-containing protein n=1 Tax=Fusarium oligoseptatum TaxID=2604345 RepID=A0A428T2Z6_9HYPO|nr:hypothetical protein CEP52_011517 [Fusarium oligoseptatum]